MHVTFGFPWLAGLESYSNLAIHYEEVVFYFIYRLITNMW